MAARERIILSATERDRPGLVADVTGFLADRGCNVDDSRVVVLGGHAGLMLLVSGEPRAVDAVVSELKALEQSAGVRLVARRLGSERDAAAPPSSRYLVRASALDHEGIIHRITDAVYSTGSNILDLETTTESAPMTGSPLLSLRMEVALPDGPLAEQRLRAALDGVAREEGIDLDVEAAEREVGERG